MGKRSEFQRRPQDAYQTIDPDAVAALWPYLVGVYRFAEPCAGEGWLVMWLGKLGLHCDLVNDPHRSCGGVDALTITDFGPAQAIITNPPWTRPLLHEMILHFQRHRPTWLLFDSDWAYNRSAAPFIWRCTDIVAVGRLRWIEDTDKKGKDNCSWYRFWHEHEGGPRFHGRI